MTSSFLRDESDGGGRAPIALVVLDALVELEATTRERFGGGGGGGGGGGKIGFAGGGHSGGVGVKIEAGGA